MTSGDSGAPSDEVERLLTDLARWMGDERADEAARSRSRERWLRQQAVEEASFAGIAVDLAERGVPVALHTSTGRTYRGSIVAVATDFLVIAAGPAAAGVDGRPGPVTLIALAAVSLLRPAAEVSGPASVTEPLRDRRAPADISMASALAGLAGDRPDVQLGVAGSADPLAGELRAVGGDVVTLRLATDPPRSVYVRLASVTECSLFGSG